jgi:hypothetical protein
MFGVCSNIDNGITSISFKRYFISKRVEDYQIVWLLIIDTWINFKFLSGVGKKL